MKLHKASAHVWLAAYTMEWAIQWGYVPRGPGEDSNAQVDLKPHCGILVRSNSPLPGILLMMAF